MRKFVTVFVVGLIMAWSGLSAVYAQDQGSTFDTTGPFYTITDDSAGVSVLINPQGQRLFYNNTLYQITVLDVSIPTKTSMLIRNIHFSDCSWGSILNWGVEYTPYNTKVKETLAADEEDICTFFGYEWGRHYTISATPTLAPTVTPLSPVATLTSWTITPPPIGRLAFGVCIVIGPKEGIILATVNGDPVPYINGGLQIRQKEYSGTVEVTLQIETQIWTGAVEMSTCEVISQ